MAARAVVGSAVKGALSGDDKEELDENSESETEGNAEAKKFLQTISKRYAGRREGIIDEVKKRLKAIKNQLAAGQLSDDDVIKLEAEAQVYTRYISDINFDFQSPDPLSQAQRQSQAVDNNNQKLSTKDMEKRVMGTLAGPGAIAAAMRLVGPDAYSKKSTPKKYGSHKVAEDDSIDKQHDNQGFTDKEIKMAYGIANDPRYKDGNMSGAIKAIESIKKGLSDHPSVEKVLQATQMEETKSGGMTFAGDYETGPAGQWRNTGKTKGRPAKVGDLVGAESIGDDTYSTGDTVTLRNGSEWTLEVDRTDGTIWATDEDGNEVELDEIVGQIVDHGKPEDRKDHSPDNMPDEIIDEAEMNEMRRLSGLEEAGKPTTNSKHSKERDLKQYDPAHGHTKPEGGNPQVCSCITSSGPSTDCAKCQGTGEIITPKRKDPKVDEAENSPDGNVGADDDGANDKYNQDAETVADRKSIQEDEDLLDIIRSIKL